MKSILVSAWRFLFGAVKAAWEFDAACGKVEHLAPAPPDHGWPVKCDTCGGPGHSYEKCTYCGNRDPVGAIRIRHNKRMELINALFPVYR